MKRNSLPKCPKCKLSVSITLTYKTATCGSCYTSWKPSPGVIERIKVNAYAKYERLNRRDARGWLVRDYDHDLSKLTTEEQIKHRDRLTRHLDGLAEEGFVDRGVVEPQHSGYCYVIGENGLELTTCDADCPVAVLKREQYLASAFREHSGQLVFHLTSPPN